MSSPGKRLFAGRAGCVHRGEPSSLPGLCELSSFTPPHLQIKKEEGTVGSGAFLQRSCPFEVARVSPGLGLAWNVGWGDQSGQ